MRNHRVGNRSWAATLALLALASVIVPSAQAKAKDKDKKQEQPRAVGIYLLSHLPLAEISVSNIVASYDRNRQLLQLTDLTHRTISVVDVTKADKPKLLGQSEIPAEFAKATLQVRIGDAALFSEADGDASAAMDPRSLTLVSFADPSHPKAVQKFEGVTAVWNDAERELIFLANADGLWVLQVYSAADKRAEEQFEEMFKGSFGGG